MGSVISMIKSPASGAGREAGIRTMQPIVEYSLTLQRNMNSLTLTNYLFAIGTIITQS